MSRPRLVVIASTYPAHPGDGTPAFVRDLAIAEAQEFDTTVIVPAVPGAAAREQDGPLQVRRFRFFPRRWEDLAAGAILENLRSAPHRWLQLPSFFAAECFALRRAVRRSGADVVHVHWLIPQGIAALLVARRMPTLVTTLGGDLYALRDPVSRSLIRAVVRKAAAITTMNQDMRARLIELGADPATTVVLPMGADVDVIRPLSAAVTREPGRILFVGRLVDKKGVEVLIRALRGLAGGYQARVVGDGPLRAELERLAAGLPVTFAGTVGREQLAAEYGAAAVAVFPSVQAASGDQDGLPVAMLEAMATGCAVVASDLPGISEAIADGESGLLVQAGSVDQLRDALDRVLAEPDLQKRLGAGAASRADQFSVAEVGRRYRELLTAVLAHHDSGPGAAAGPASVIAAAER
jgi:glycosyltransferase involved in cell wall biosynthesis